MKKLKTADGDTDFSNIRTTLKNEKKEEKLALKKEKMAAKEKKN